MNEHREIMQKYHLIKQQSILNEHATKGLIEFANKNGIPDDELFWEGSGSFGNAYSYKDKVIKQTNSKTEYDIAKRILKENKNDLPFVKFYDIAHLDYFYILMEKVIPIENINKYENLYFQFQELLSQQNLSLLELEYFDDSDIEDIEMKKFSDRMYMILMNYKEYATIPDFWINNLGINGKGELIAFDLHDKAKD